MADNALQTDLLLRRARGGDDSAVEQLFDLHRNQLRRMVAVRMDGRIVARVDPSDVVQDALAEASRRFSEYLQGDDEMFYPWLRKITWERLVQLHRHHIHAQKRSVEREALGEFRLSNQSALRLSQCLASSIPTPSAAMMQDEMHTRVREHIERLSAQDREVLVLRHLEQLSIAEVAAVLKISQAAVQSRYRRALERLHALLTDESKGEYSR